MRQIKNKELLKMCLNMILSILHQRKKIMMKLNKLLAQEINNDLQKLHHLINYVNKLNGEKKTKIMVIMMNN